MEITDHTLLTEQYNEDRVIDRYREFRESENIPYHHELFYDNCDKLETGKWKRTGQRGALLNLHGTQNIFDIHLHELIPGGETTIQHHLYQEIVYVSQGRGSTQIGTGKEAINFEWQEGSLFFIPQSVPYKHINQTGDEPARLFAQTVLPQLLELLQYEETIFNPQQDLWSESLKHGDFYSSDGNLYGVQGEEGRAVWEANFIPNLLQFDKLHPRPSRGACEMVAIDMPKSSIWVHSAEFQKGQYMNAHHRAGPAAVYTILSGEGYSLMWQPDWDKIGKIEWSPGSIISYPHDCLHQHFNTGEDPARYLAWHTPNLGTLGDIDMYNANVPQNIINYIDEAPVIREHYRDILEEKDQELRMPDKCYTDPNFDVEELLSYQ